MSTPSLPSIIWPLAIAWFSSLSAHATETQADESVSKIPILTRQVRVVDQSGQPVQGVKVEPWSVNERYFWPSRQVPITHIRTDSDGVASILYPEAMDHSERIKAESLSVAFYHPDFIHQRAIVPVNSKEKSAYEVRMEPGISVTIDAIDEAGQPVDQPFAVMTAGYSGPKLWNRPAPHLVHCRSLATGNQQIMLVQPLPDGELRFSDVLTFRFDLEQQPEVVLEEIELLSGITISGKLSSEVPRPIQNGWVTAVHIPLPAGDSWDDTLPSLLYYAATGLDEEGRFEFKSMPRTGIVQLIAGCDGWVGLQDQQTPFIVGQTFDVDYESLEVELEMKPTFDAVIRVIDQQGDPVPGVHVGFSPNQRYEKGGSTILGNKPNSLNGLMEQIDADYPAAEVHDMNSQYSAVSDQEGLVVIRNLPRNRWSLRCSVWSTETSGTQIKGKEDGKGRLPAASKSQVEYDIVVERVDNESQN